MMVLIGQFLGESEKDFTWADKQTGEVKSGTERNLHILDGLYTITVARSRDFKDADLPAVGQEVALDVWARGIGRSVAYFARQVLDLRADDVAPVSAVRAAS